jgi:hypothetical protein
MPAKDGLWGDGSRGEVVLVDEPTEDVAPPDLSGSVGERGWLWRSEHEAAVRPTMVAVADILGEDPLQVAPGHDKKVVEAVLSDGAHPTNRPSPDRSVESVGSSSPLLASCRLGSSYNRDPDRLPPP